MSCQERRVTMEIGDHEVQMRDDLASVTGESVYECVDCGNQALDSFNLEAINCK